MTDTTADDERFMHHFVGLRDLDLRLEKLLDEKKERKAKAKLDKVPMSRLDLALKVAAAGDTARFVEQLTDMVSVLTQFQLLPAGTQVDMFPTARPEDEKAATEGKRDAALGRDRANHYADGSEAGKAYEFAYDAQHAANLKAFGKKLKATAEIVKAPKGSAVKDAADRAEQRQAEAGKVADIGAERGKRTGVGEQPPAAH